MTLPAEFTYEHTPELMRAAARRALIRSNTQNRVYLAVILVFGIAPILFNVLRGRVGWIECAFTAVLYMFVWGAYSQRKEYLRHAEALVRSMPSPWVRVRFEEDFLTIETEERTSKNRWSVVKSVWKSLDFWMVFSADGVYLVIPTSAIPAELREYLEQKVRAQGGTIRWV